MIRLYMAEDHALVRDGLRLLVSTCPDLLLVGETGDGAEVLAQVRALAPDVLLLDLGLPQVDGIELLRALAREPSPPRVLVVTARIDAASVRTALALGAAGYLSKGVRSDELLAAVRAVGEGGRWVGPEFMDLVAEKKDWEAEALTPREREILSLVAAGLSSRQIADRQGISEGTVRKHRENIGRKIGARNPAEMTAYAIANGYRAD